MSVGGRVFRLYPARGGIPEHGRKGASDTFETRPGISFIPQPYLKLFNGIRNGARIESPDGVHLVVCELCHWRRSATVSRAGGVWLLVERGSHGFSPRAGAWSPP